MSEKRFNVASRIIHWTIAFTLLFIVLTVLLRLGWMHKDHLGSILQKKLASSGTIISKDDAGAIGKELRKPMWNNHVLAGYILIGLYILRMLINLKQGIAFSNPFSKSIGLRERFKSWVYIIFYLLLFLSLGTGYLIANGPAEWKDTLKIYHFKGLYYVFTFIVIHMAGVFIADYKEEKGIISKMMTGDRNA